MKPKFSFTLVLVTWLISMAANDLAQSPKIDAARAPAKTEQVKDEKEPVSAEASLGVVLTTKSSPIEEQQIVSLYAQFIDAVDGLTADDVVRYALAHNGDLTAARQMIVEARGRLRQSGL